MNKKLNIILSLVMAVAIIAVSGVAYSDKKVASADIGTYDLYCFSDGGVLPGYVNQLITNDVIDTYVMNPCYPSAPSSSYDFWDYINDIYNSDDVQSIENAFIIFEISETFPMEATGTGSLVLPQKLEILFGAWYENGCTIMFISGTTEVRFRDYNDFLDYVTIQIDLDLESLWAMNVIYRLEQMCDERIQNTTMIMDAFVGVNLQYSPAGINAGNNWFFRNYVVPYFKIAYIDELYGSVTGIMDFFDDYGIKLLKQIPVGNLPQGVPVLAQQAFKDILSNQDIQFSSNSDEDIAVYHNEVMTGLGSSYYGAAHGLYWESIMMQMRAYYTDFPIYMHNPNATSYQTSTSDDFYYAGPFLSIYNCIYDFIVSNDISEYHNLTDSRCAVSYLPLESSPDGWLIPLDEIIEELYGSSPSGIPVGDDILDNHFSLYATSAVVDYLTNWFNV